MIIAPQNDPAPLICFAVKQEAQGFRKHGARVLITGMGRRRAEKAIETALAAEKPSLILTCGFAGALRPDLPRGTVLFDARGREDVAARLEAAGARPGRFHCSSRVATTAQEKTLLRTQTGADAVEMESQSIAAICQERQLRCAIVRVVLDEASEDLPLDFNALMNEEQQIKYGRLAWTLLKAPGKIGALLRLQKQSRFAAQRLGQVIERVIGSARREAEQPRMDTDEHG